MRHVDTIRTECQCRVGNTATSYSERPEFQISAQGPGTLTEVFRFFFQPPHANVGDSTSY
jgi:hypothetical protein